MELVAENKFKQTDLGEIPIDWQLMRLGDCTTKIGSGITPTGGEKVYKDEGRAFIRSQNVGWGNLILDDIAFIDDATHETFSSTEIKLEDVFLNITGASIGRSALADYRVVNGNVNQHVCIVRTNSTTLNPRFLNYFLLSKTGQKQVDSFQSGGNRQGLNFGQLKEFLIPIPPISEQTAIATALSDADNYINSLEKLIAKKQAIKQGAMQKLLTPKADWVVKKLGEVAEIRKGQLITEGQTVIGDIPVIAGGMKPSYFHNKSNRKGNTVTVSASGANAGFVAFHASPIFASDCSTIEDGENYDVRFLFFLLQSKQSLIYKQQTGGAQPHIYPEQLKQLEVSIPNDKKEQTHIATILSDMDADIAATEKQLAKARSIKQGMMQQLLTGKIRLL